MKELKSLSKEILKEALRETLQEERELLGDVLTEGLEDFALTEAIREGRKTKKVPRDAIFRSLRSKS